MSDEKDLEELLKIASQEVDINKIKPPTKKKKESVAVRRARQYKDFLNFMSDTKLLNGPVELPSWVVYDCYRDYSEDPMPSKSFFGYLTTQLANTRSADNHRTRKVFSNMSERSLKAKCVYVKKRREQYEKIAEAEKNKEINGKVPESSEGTKSKS